QYIRILHFDAEAFQRTVRRTVLNPKIHLVAIGYFQIRAWVDCAPAVRVPDSCAHPGKPNPAEGVAEIVGHAGADGFLAGVVERHLLHVRVVRFAPEWR